MYGRLPPTPNQTGSRNGNRRQGRHFEIQLEGAVMVPFMEEVL
jgi:hypothetical protein